MRRWAVALAWLGSISCNSPMDSGGDLPARAEVQAYLENVLSIMRANSIKRLTIDWNSFNTTVRNAAGSAQSIPALYPAIHTALTLLGDSHSTYRGANGTVLAHFTRSCSAAPWSRPSLPANIGYVRVTGFSGSGAASDAFAKAIQDSIRMFDRDGLIGWIVDLRSNTGGNMWPMVSGIGPILGEGTLGYFIDPVGTEGRWEYRDGASMLDGGAVHAVLPSYRLKVPNPRVAVLTDNRVASSGEAVAVAFRQRPNTITLGTSTCGLSTANRGFPMPDGGLLNLTTAVFADRAKTIYGDQLPPDEVIADAALLVQRAIGWLQTGR